jgi:two-component sensor histidine kinase
MAFKLPPEQLIQVYPDIKDTLTLLKKKVYYKTISNEAKFLFDVIDARIETANLQHHKAIYILENSLRFHVENFNDSLTVLNLLSPAYIKLRNYNKAYEIQEIFERVQYRFPEEFKKTFSPKKSYIYLQLGMYKQSVEELRKEFHNKPVQMQNDTNVLGNFFNDMGVHFNRANVLDSAMFYFNKAKVLIDAKSKYDKNKTYYDFFSGLIDGNIASALAKEKHFQEAIPPLKKDIYYSLKANNLISAANSYNLIAKCFLELKKYDVARKYIDSAKVLISKTEELGPTLNNILTEAKYFKSIGNLNKASEYYDKYIQFKDSVQKVDNESKLINQQISFDLYQQENQLVQKEKQIQQSKLLYEHEKTKRSYLLLGLIILALVIAFLIINNQLNKRRQSELFIKNKHIIQQKTAIENALKEKEFLIKEIHHRVKNNLQIISSMLSLQSDVIENKEAKDVLQESRLRINSMSLIHQMLYAKNNMTDIAIAEYFKNLMAHIEKSYSLNNKNIQTHLNCQPLAIDLDTAIPLGLIVNELVTNSYKHAFTSNPNGLIDVSFHKSATGYTLIVSDNGLGYVPEDGKSQGLGMELIYMLVEQLGGSIVFTKNNGTTAVVNFNS